MHESDYLWNEDETSQKYFMLANMICSLPLWRVTSHIYDRVVTYYITTASHLHSYSGPRVPGSAASTDAGRWDNSGFRYKLQGRCSGMQSCSSVYRMQSCRSVYVMQHSICMFWALLADNQSARLPLELGLQVTADSRQRAPHLWPADHNLSFSKYSDWEWAW